MKSKNLHIYAIHKTSSTYLVLAALLLYFMLLFYHGFQVYGSDTIETVPYALWMNDNSLFLEDFHQSNLRTSTFNERVFSVFFLHLFGEHIVWGSRILHFIFTFVLCAGLIRFSDLFLKHFSLSVVVVFITLFPLYNINIGGNELYYNMYVPSLLAKAIAIWALIFMYKKNLLYSGLLLGITTCFQPLVGLQLFAVSVPLLLFWEGLKKGTAYFICAYLITGGICVASILWAQGPNIESSASFFDIVRFRIAHHFFPGFFPKSHIAILIPLYLLGSLYFIKSNRFIALFFLFSLLGLGIYLLGVSQEIDTILSSQFMKINIWLKYFSIIGIIGLIKRILERKQYDILAIVLFSGAFIFSIIRHNPTYDAPYPSVLYDWVELNTAHDDLFLVPPELNDFKARTKRSSYFDFKAMLHHKPAIYDWYNRFNSIYDMRVEDRTQEMDIFSVVKEHYLKGEKWNGSVIDYIITRENQDIPNRELIFETKQYKVYK